MKLLFSHNDLDGVGSILLYKYFNLDFDKSMIGDYNFEETKEEQKNEILTYDKVYFTDFCPSEEFLNKLLELNKKVWIYDHHESSLFCKEIKHDNLIVFHDLTKSGTKIFYENFIKITLKRVPIIVEQLIELIDTYDCWKIKSELWEEAQNLNRVLYATMNWDTDSQYVYNDFIVGMLDKMKKYNKWQWSFEEQRIIKNAKDKEDNVYKKSNEMLQVRKDEKGKMFGLFKASSKISIVCARLLERYSGLDYIICINTFKPEEKKLSIRSLGFDCTQLQNVYGHKEAAASVFETIEEINDFWNGRIWSIRYKGIINDDR